jgi:hypothetical protein
MSVESKRMPTVAAMMIGMFLNDPEALTFGYALAASQDDEGSVEIAQFFKQQAMNLGVTEEKLQMATEAVKNTDEFIRGLDSSADEITTPPGNPK